MHTFELDDVLRYLPELDADLGYIALSREPGHQIGRMEWDVAACVARGLLAEGADAGDLPSAAEAWLSSAMTADAPPGQRAVYRIRLCRPKGGALKQVLVAAEPDDDDAAPALSGGATDAGAALAERLLAAQGAEYRAIIAAYREMLADQRKFLAHTLEDGRQSRENVQALFDAHVRRELGIVDARARQVEARAKEIEARVEGGQDDGLVDSLVKVGTQLWAVHHDLPPDLVAAVAEDDELKDLLADPALVSRLRDPTTKQLLRAALQGGF